MSILTILVLFTYFAVLMVTGCFYPSFISAPPVDNYRDKNAIIEMRYGNTVAIAIDPAVATSEQVRV